MGDRKIYLDNNATTPLEKNVIERIYESSKQEWGNPSSSHVYGAKAKVSVNKAREQLAGMLNGRKEEIIFTSGGTEANNIVLFGIVRYYKDFQGSKETDKPHVITTDVEHDSVALPLRYLEENGLIEVEYVKASKNGSIVPEDVYNSIKNNTSLITIMYANNETGVIMPIGEVGNKLKDINKERASKGLIKILYHSDAAQIVGKESIDVKALNVDYLTIVGHKFYAPRIGCLWATAVVYPLLFGGGQEGNLRPGTENTPMIAGLGVAAELVTKNIDSYRKHMLQLRQLLENQLKDCFGDKVFLNCEDMYRLPNTCNVSFIGDFLGSELLSNCKYVIASVGAACHSGDKCSKVLLNSGVPLHLAKTALRLSVGRYTTESDIKDCVSDLREAYELVCSKC